MPDNDNTDWNIKLNFDLPPVGGPKLPPPSPKKIPARHLLAERFPRIMKNIDAMWGSKQLHIYFEETLYTERSGRSGFPPEVMLAIGELHTEHQILLKRNRILKTDVWDLNFNHKR